MVFPDRRSPTLNIPIFQPRCHCSRLPYLSVSRRRECNKDDICSVASHDPSRFPLLHFGKLRSATDFVCLASCRVLLLFLDNSAPRRQEICLECCKSTRKHGKSLATQQAKYPSGSTISRIPVVHPECLFLSTLVGASRIAKSRGPIHFAGYLGSLSFPFFFSCNSRASRAPFTDPSSDPLTDLFCRPSGITERQQNISAFCRNGRPAREQGAGAQVGRRCAAAAIQPSNEERHDAPSDPSDSDEKHDDDTDDIAQAASPNRLDVTKSVATDVSDATGAPSTGQPPPAKAKPWYRQINPLRWGGVPPVPKERIVSREYTAGFFSKLTFQWMTPLMTTGYKRQLEKADIWQVNPDRAVEPLTQKVKESFHRRVQNGEKNPLFWALHETFKFEFWLGGLCALITAILQVLAPFTLRFLIQFATDAYIANVRGGPPPPIKNGIGLAIGITAMQIFQAFGVSHFIYRGMMMGGQSRGVLIGFIYEKAMVISGRAKAGGVKPSIMPESDDADEVEKGKETATDEQSAGKKKKKTKTKKGKPQQDGLGWANGRIVNLMSVDTYRIDQASALFHMIWTSPVVCLITLVLLLVNLTYSALAGFALLVVGVPALTKAIQTLFRRRKAINKITDQRVSLTQEILQSVRFVKYFGWEKAFIARLGEFRAKEIYSIQVLLAIRNAINAVSMSLPIFASMLSFIVYSLSNHDLAPAEVFSSLALFNGLRIPLNLLPLVLGQVTDAWSSMKRIEEFLMQEEQEEDVVYKPEGSNAVEMIDAAFTWERTATQDPDKATIAGAGKEKRGVKDGAKESTSTPKPAKSQSSAGNSEEDSGSTLVEEREPFKLQGLNFQISRNELVAVIGTVGSGKSSLLAALAGDMRKTNGDVVYGASRAFCPQYAWIQNTTLQNNITFGKDMDRDWYREVVRACALQADLDMLPNGDQTEIGERGITISGGQKQRLNIARAIYFNADIVIMDDPLSAVDAHVGRHIFDNAILGLLKDKCRILATHQLWVLSRCDRIIWMDGGKIQAIDTFDNLMRDHRGFQSLMETTAVEEKEEEPRPRAPVDLADERKKRKRNKKGAALMQQEEKPESSVPWSVYAAYVRASGSILNAPLVITILIISQGANIVTGLWLSWWTSDKFGYSTGKYIGIYAALGGCPSPAHVRLLRHADRSGNQVEQGDAARSGCSACYGLPCPFSTRHPSGASPTASPATWMSRTTT
ncbi:ATP-binding cassette transporter yor1 [Metarhizium acridum]|nr:ATP-binding cassette transporter yor1 [Metarhizium acridum]